MFGLKLRTCLPGIVEYMTEDLEVKDWDIEAKAKEKMYVDNKRQAKESDIKKGDFGLAKAKITE